VHQSSGKREHAFQKHSNTNVDTKPYGGGTQKSIFLIISEYNDNQSKHNN
jgi:hypothetical protein